MWGLYVGYYSSAVGYVCVLWQTYLFGAYANNVKCMHISAPGNIVSSNEFI